ncbi:vacuolar morphogenesis protein 7 [[Candida] railenensis]|uniref:Vacuolar morphogenesis protein 7 n=1 Tax=[Candida] railenensis TaxID=45579 RepID=A0A9P0QWF9_9ASCO|nr:vacuolar morphogenesis protein 7 [[Candida] railenensis]
MIASIPTTSTQKNVIYYHVNIKLPLRSITTLKRFSDFYSLVDSLCSNLKIKVKDFPYELPSKKIGSSWFSGSENSPLVQDRALELSKFVNSIIQDRELQNHPLVHQFLELPLNFKFTEAITKPKSSGNDLDDLVLPSDQSLVTNWQEYARKFKFHISQLSSQASSASSITSRLEIREKVTKVIKPNLIKLERAANENATDKLEVKRKQMVLSDISSELESLLKKLESPKSAANSSTNNRLDLLGSRRVFGGNTEQASETNDTLPLNNQELIQQQVQVQKNQDQEIEQLRKIIQRQRQIGEVINNEVMEQNDILDGLNEDVERTSEKLRSAKTRVRKLG